MAARELRVARRITLKASYCVFMDSHAEILGAGKRKMLFLHLAVLGPAILWLIQFVLFLASKASALAAGITTGLAPLVASVAQLVAQSNVRIEFATADGAACTVQSKQFPLFSKPSVLSVQVSNSDTDIQIHTPEKSEGHAEVAGEKILTVRKQPVRGFVVRMPPLHLELTDREGRRATLDQLRRKGGTYRLAYDEELQPQWLLYVVIATLLLR